MIRRIVFFLTVVIVTAACGIARADYVTVTQGGYGPFACASDGGGPLPSWGFVERYTGSFYSYGCERYRGDIATSSHAGRSFDFVSAGDPYLSAKVSSTATTAYLCYDIVAGNTPVPCDSGYVTATSDTPWAGDWRNGLVIGYSAPCPLTPNETTLTPCTGACTPYDGSGLPTAVISDGIPKPGLPLGSPLKLPPTVGSDVSCIATMSNYPGVPNHGHDVWMAVYVCPCP